MSSVHSLMCLILMGRATEFLLNPRPSTHFRRVAFTLLVAPGSPLASYIDGQKLPPHSACARHIWQQLAHEALCNCEQYDRGAVAAGC